jgi:PAS domain S-box-containing protein
LTDRSMSDFSPKKSLKKKLLWQFSAFVVVMMVLITFLVSFMLIKALTRDLQISLSVNAYNSLKSIEHRVSFLAENTKNFSRKYFIINSLIDIQGRDLYLPKLIDDFERTYDVHGVTIVDFEGNVIQSSFTAPPNYKEMEELRYVITLGKAQVRLSADKKNIVIMEPIEYYKTPQGAVIAEYSLNRIVSLMLPKDDEIIFQNICVKEECLSSKNAKKDKAYISVRQQPKEDSPYLSRLGIGIEAGALKKEYFKPVWNTLFQLLLIGSLFIITAVFLAVKIGNNISRPILKLCEKIRKLENSGKEKCSPTGTGDELEDLAQIFDERTEQIEEAMKHLEKQAVALRKSNDLLEQEIAERKKTEDELRESEEKFRGISISANDAIIMMDNEGKIAYWNKAAERIFGYSGEEVLCKELHILLAPNCYHKDYRKNILNFNTSGKGFAVGKTLELEAVKKDGTEFPIELSVSAVKIKNKWNAIGILRDITERKQAENEIKNKANQLSALCELGKKITTIISMDKLLPWIAQEAEKFLDADGCHYRLREGDYLVRGGGSSEGVKLMIKEKVKIGEGVSGKIAKKKRPLIIENMIDNDPWHIKEYKEEAAIRLGFLSFLGVPMMIGDNVIGVLNVYSKKPGKYVKEDSGLLSAFANYAAIAIENARLFKEAIEKFGQFKALYDINKMLASKFAKGEDILPFIAEHANRLLNADGCFFRLRKKDKLVFSCGIGKVTALGLKREIGESVSGLLARNKKPLVIGNIKNDERFLLEPREQMAGSGYMSFLGVPMMAENEVVGVINVLSKKPDKFTDKDITLLSAFADQAAIVIKNMEYLEKIKKAQGVAIMSEKLASIGRLVAGVTHEILNPLNIISARTQLLMMQNKNSKNLTEPLQIMKKQADRIVKISQALLDFSRERKAEDIKDVNINEVIQDSLILIEKELLLKNIEIKKELDKNLPNITTDKNQMRQVVFNLITNARDAMPKEGTIIISTKSNREKNTVLLSVKDSGSGIPPENLDKIFDPFFTTKEEGKGTGLGLSVCFGIVEDYGGKIWAENNQDRGATFFIEFPVKEEA